MEGVPETEAESQLNLLSTIRVPRNIKALTDRLPKPNYTSPLPKDKKKKEGFLPLIGR
jgi:hypothetical protein